MIKDYNNIKEIDMNKKIFKFEVIAQNLTQEFAEFAWERLIKYIEGLGGSATGMFIEVTDEILKEYNEDNLQSTTKTNE